MKKFLIYLCFVFILIVFCACIFAIVILNPFKSMGMTIQKDYVNNKHIFEKVTTNNHEDTFITKENYDKSSEELNFIFNTLQYESIRVSYGTVFFCKGYDGMSRIGLLFSKGSFSPNSKQNVIKRLNEYWMVLEENIL